MRPLPFAPPSFACASSETYHRDKVMPVEASADADHLALATFHRCDILVTWNCQHIANANKFPHIRRINALLGHETPQLVTPLELLSPDE